MIHEKTVEIESVKRITGRGTVLVVRIPVEEGSPVVGSEVTSVMSGNSSGILSVEYEMTLMTVPRRKELLGLIIRGDTEFAAGEKVRIMLKKE